MTTASRHVGLPIVASDAQCDSDCCEHLDFGDPRGGTYYPNCALFGNLAAVRDEAPTRHERCVKREIRSDIHVQAMEARDEAERANDALARAIAGSTPTADLIVAIGRAVLDRHCRTKYAAEELRSVARAVRADFGNHADLFVTVADAIDSIGTEALERAGRGVR